MEVLSKIPLGILGSSGATVGYFGVLRGHHWGDVDILGSSGATVGYFGVLRGHPWVFWGPPVPPLGGHGYFGAKCGDMDILGSNVGDLGSP